MNVKIGIGAQEGIKTVVLDGLSWRDVALGAVLMLLLVLLFIALVATRENSQHGVPPEEGGGLSDPVRKHR